MNEMSMEDLAKRVGDIDFTMSRHVLKAARLQLARFGAASDLLHKKSDSRPWLRSITIGWLPAPPSQAGQFKH
jgi:hypothetical protein